MKYCLDKSGLKFGRLTVIKKANLPTRNNQNFWWCNCSCNNMSIAVQTGYLTSGDVKSCGCLFDENQVKLTKNLKNWQKNQPLKTKQEKLQGRRIYETTKYKNDMNFRLSKNLRSRLKYILKTKKSASAIRNLGCSIDELKIHLEKQFTKGMTWENYGFGKDKWSIDHIKPLSLFDLTIKEELLKAIHYTNLQPMWCSDNFSKRNKYVG